MKLDKIESLGHGVTRMHAAGVGYADVAARYRTNLQGWDVEVQQTNVQDATALDQMVLAFRRSEGMDA